MEKKQFYKMVFALILPMALQNLINAGVTATDVIMLGKVGETALSAASLANQISFILNLIIFGLTSGAAVLTAQYWGKKDVRTIEKVIGLSFRLAVIIGVVFAAAALFIPRQLMLIFTTDEEMIAAGISYLQVVAGSYLLMSVNMVYLNIVRSVERVLIATVAYGISLTVNIILNAIFIFGLLGFPAMGIAGAALGTTLARLCESAVVVIHAKYINKTIKIRLTDFFVREKKLVRDFWKYAGPVIFNELVWGVGMAATTAIIGHLGSAAAAAQAVAATSRQLAMVVAFGVAGAAALVLGKTIGEGKEELAKVYAGRFVRLALLMGIAGAAVILCVSPIARHFLELTPEAREYLKNMMYVMSYFCFAQSLNCTFVVGICRAGGDTRFGLILDVATLWGGSLVMGMITAFVLKLPVSLVYVFLVSDELLKLPFAYRRYRSMRWIKNITR